jgi:TetR/AcrR family transcriptional repressor of nem operon
MKLYPQVEHRDDWWLSWFDGDVQSTRQKLLLAAFREIHFYGYQAASIQNIINQAEVTKGAFYHHFKSKHDMVVALIDEVYTNYVENTFIKPIQDTDDPISALIQVLYGIREQMSDHDIVLGCPLDSLAQEMAPIDEEIQRRINTLYRYKLKKLTTAFRRGQVAGNVKRDVSADSIALFIMATLQGCMGIAKSARSVDVLTQCSEGLIHYLYQLRVESDF